MTGNRKRVAMAIVLDESGSMESVRSTTINGVNEWLNDQKRDTATEAFLLLVKFGSELRVLNSGQVAPLASIPELTPNTYQPRGNTALRDAVGYVLTRLQTFDADSYVVLIVTDGAENASREFSMQRLQALMAECEAKPNWSITFLGANLDAWGGAQSIGMRNAGGVAQYSATPTSVQATFAAASRGTSQYRDGVARGEVLDPNAIAQSVMQANVQLDPAINPAGTTTTPLQRPPLRP
jgi:hypothetical protein